MGNFNRERGGNKNFRGFNNNKRRGFSDYGRPTMHEAVCTNCGKLCEVPFRPSGDKPVLCNDCFGKDDNRRENRSNRPAFQNRTANVPSDLKAELNAINQKLDRLLRALEIRGQTEQPKALDFSPENIEA